VDSSWRQYIRGLRLGRFPMISLWKSQKKALDGGLLGKNSLVLSMPTSSGKTRTVELAIYDVLKDNPDKLCVYIVPTRALAAEIEQSLSSRLGRMGIKVSVLYGGYDFSPFEEQMLAENQVIVLTPEKLDLITRQNEDFKKKISLAIIDEVQEVARASSRSMRMEFILSRILYLAAKNNARVLCLSAVIKNSEDFAKWISQNTEGRVETEWRPTLQRYGQFQWSRGRGRVWYPPLPDEFPTEDYYVLLLFRRRELQYEDGRRTEVAARVSLFYSRTGATLVFTTTKALVETIADIISEIMKSDPLPMTPERDEIVNTCVKILGEDHKLVTAIKLGFCYHHGELPRSVRRILERGIKNGALPLIVSTTTLTEGVNLPIKNVIVHSLHHYNEISTAQFWNAAGRAGRAGYETEGHIIFCFDEDRQRIAESELEASESFVSSGIRLLIQSRLPSADSPDDFLEKWALASTQQFRKDWANYDSWGNTKRRNAEAAKNEILSTLDSQLLAWALEESVDEIDDKMVTRWFGRMLFSVQTLDIPEETKKFRYGIRNRALAVKKLVANEEERRLYNRTGLSISSNRMINDVAKKLQSILPTLQDTDRLPREFWLTIHSSLKEIPEISKLSKIKGELLADWAEGTDYKKLADDYYDGDIEKTVKDVEAATFSFPWGSHSLIQHLKTLVEEDDVPNLVMNLPSLVYHGVPTLAAVYALNLGVFDRQLAIKVADKYLAEHESLTYHEFKDWLQGMEYSVWIEMLKGENNDLVDECYERLSAKRDISKQPSVILDFNLSDMCEIEEVADEDIIVVKYSEDFWLCTFDYQRIGKLVGENISRLEVVDRRNYDLIVEDFVRKEARVSVRIL
jgi:replicative superfamily II helicase